MIINTNIVALRAYNNLISNQHQLTKSIARLSSGKRINSAADDPAGLAISERMKAQISGLHQAQRNAQDAISLVQTAEGGLKETHSILQRIRELALQSATSTYTPEDRTEIQAEVDQLIAGLGDISQYTEFNTKNLLNGSFSGVFQIGANKGQTMELNIKDMQPAALGLSDGSGNNIDLTDPDSAEDALDIVDDAISNVSSQRAQLGAVQSRLGHTINNLQTTENNLIAAESRITDVDMAHEIMNMVHHQILVQVGIAILAQANQIPQSILQLLPN